MYKINKKTAEKKVLMEKKLSIFKIYDKQYPISRLGVPIMAA